MSGNYPIRLLQLFVLRNRFIQVWLGNLSAGLRATGACRMFNRRNDLVGLGKEGWDLYGYFSLPYPQLPEIAHPAEVHSAGCVSSGPEPPLWG